MNGARFFISWFAERLIEGEEMPDRDGVSTHSERETGIPRTCSNEPRTGVIPVGSAAR